VEAYRIVRCRGSHIVLDKRLTHGGEIVSLTGRPRSTPQKHFLVLISVRGRVNPRATVRLEGLKTKLRDPSPRANYTDRATTRAGRIRSMENDLLACSIAP
jgi:hypothetical protein